jgi:hypothetical protein
VKTFVSKLKAANPYGNLLSLAQKGVKEFKINSKMIENVI